MDETQGVVSVAPKATVRKPARPAHPLIEALICAAGSLVTLSFPSLGVMAMVFGAWLLAREEEGRTWLAVAACALPGIALSFVSWDYGSLALPCIICALVVALVLPHRVSVSSVCLTVIALTAAMIAADASMVMLWGETFAAYVDALLAELRELTVASLGGSASVAALATVDQTLELLGKTWPLLYAARAAGATILGLLGLMLARRDTCQGVYSAFLRYDAPLWSTAVLVAGVLCLAWSAFGLWESALFEAIGLNIVLFLRFVFLLQALAVGMCLMDRRAWGPVPRVLVLAAMLVTEMGLYAASVFGILDVWANFRNLERRKAQKVAESRGEGEY